MKPTASARFAATLLGLSLLAGPAFAKTTIRLAGHGDNAAVVNGLLNDVVKPMLAKDDIDAVFQPIQGEIEPFLVNALSAGTAPDLFYVDIAWATPMFASGKVAELPDDIVKTVAPDLLPNLVQAFTHEGKLYGLAKDFNTLAVEFDKDAFDDAGVPYPDASDDWNSFADKLARVQAALGDVAGTCVVPDFARMGAFAFSTGWKPFDDKGRTVLDADFRRAFEWYTGLPAKGAAVTAQDVGQGWTGGCLGAGKTATAMEGAWIGGFLRDQAPNLKYGTAPVPKDPATGQRGNFIFTVSWSAAKDSPNRDAAFKVMKALTSPEAQQWVLERGLALPSRAALAENPFFRKEGAEAELNRIVFAGASDGNVFPYEFRGLGGKWLEIMNNALSSVLLKEKTVDEAIADAQKKFDALTGHGG